MHTQRGHSSDFVPGLVLARRFFLEAVSPLLQKHFPNLTYSAGLIGTGSEVLGFDDRMSTDHHWGPRAMLFLPDPVLATHEGEIRGALGENLPESFLGYPTNWSEPDPRDPGVQHLQPVQAGPLRHRVELFSPGPYFEQYLGIDLGIPLSPSDWLTLPWQKLRSLSAGNMFRDDLGLIDTLNGMRWYPHDVWLYVLASCWTRIGQEEHLMGRAGSSGDEVGSAIIAARLVRDIMRLAFLMERVFPPYPKWFGRAFTELKCAAILLPALRKILQATWWTEREAGLTTAYRQLAEMHNALELTPPMPCEPTLFWSRPFKVIWGDRFAEAIGHVIDDPRVRSMAGGKRIGSLDLVSDNTDVLEDSTRRKRLLRWYDGPGSETPAIATSPGADAAEG